MTESIHKRFLSTTLSEQSEASLRSSLPERVPGSPFGI